MKIKLASINLEVADVERSKQFYAGVLDMVEDARRSHPPGFAYLRSDGCDVTLAAAREVPKAGPPRTVELGFEVDELPAMRARLASRGIEDYRDESMGWGSALELRDPDGHRIVVYSFKGGDQDRPG